MDGPGEWSTCMTMNISIVHAYVCVYTRWPYKAHVDSINYYYYNAFTFKLSVQRVKPLYKNLGT